MVTSCIPGSVAHHHKMTETVSPCANRGILPSLGYVLESLPGASSFKCKSVASKSPVFTTLKCISKIVPAMALLAGKS